MREGRLVLAQLSDHLPWSEFARCVQRYRPRYPSKSLSHWSQLLCMVFAQLTYRSSLRDTVTCLRSQSRKLYHAGIRGPIARSTLADANEGRDARIFQDFALHLIAQARALYADEPTLLGSASDATIYAVDSTVVDLCLGLFAWAPASKGRAGVKMHTVLDLRGNIPTVIDITGSRGSDVSFLDRLPIEAGSIYIMDRGYMHAARLMKFTQRAAFFVVRTFADLHYQVIGSDCTQARPPVLSDEHVLLTGKHTGVDYGLPVRRVAVRDALRGKTLIFLSNNFELSAQQIGQLYKARWQVELFFKCVKKHLRIKSFFGNSQNAVKIQLWTAISTYVLVAIVKKRLACHASLHDMFQVLSLNLFETTPLERLFDQLLASIEEKDLQIPLFEKIAGQ
ncbi:IS4 family transposase [Ottowia sp.]|uniref:IS4 family transposase n=1 Tax=Ottowia sp. TaxID=1898956 RepID=UPI0039E332C7